MLSELNATADSGANRRRAPRIAISPPIPGHIPSLDVAVAILDFSEGGFSIQSACDIPIGSVQHVRFTAAHSKQIVLTARAVHSLRVRSSSDLPLFFTGFESLQDEPDNAIRELAAFHNSCIE